MYESFVIFTVASVRPRTKTEYQTTFPYKPFHRNYTLEDLFHHDFELDAKILNYWNQDTTEKKLNKKAQTFRMNFISKNLDKSIKEQTCYNKNNSQNLNKTLIQTQLYYSKNI